MKPSTNDPIAPPIIENIKTFLKIKTPKAIDKQYYAISDNHQIFTLHDPELKVESSKSIKFEVDKIFTEQNENSYIFEEIGRDCIADCLEGKHFTYISYGDTSSEKYETLFGGNDCYTNIINRGIYPRILEQLLKKISSNQELNDNLSVNLSYFFVNGNKLIDLSKLMGRDISKVTEKELLQSGIEIKTLTDVTSIIKKIPTDNANEVIFFLSKVFDLLYKLEVDAFHLLTWSHFCFPIYITNNNGKLISTMTFVLLAGSENLQTQVNNTNLPTKQSIINTKVTLEREAAFLSIINGITNQKIKQRLDETEETKLSIALNKLCFNQAIEMEFRIIGNIFPNTGMHESVNNTLVFLFRCKKIVRLRPNLETLKGSIKKEVRDDVIFDLESKLAAQHKKIKELNEVLDKKQNKIEILEANYKAQIEVLKGQFNFKGDVNVLLSNDENTKEGRFAKGIRDAIDNNRIKGGRIIELEKKILTLKEDQKKLRTAQEVRDNDQTMIALYTKFKEDNQFAESNLKISNQHANEIEDLKKKNSILETKINVYQKELAMKGHIMQNLPQLLQNNLKDKDSDDEEEIDYHLVIKDEVRKRLEDKHHREIEDIKNNNKREAKVLSDKHSNLYKQKEKELVYLKNAFEKLKETTFNEGKASSEEMINLNNLIGDLISNYKKAFDPKKFHGNENSITNFQTFINIKERFDETVSSAEKSINQSHFPHLFNARINRGPYDKTKVLKEVLIPNQNQTDNNSNQTNKMILACCNIEKSVSEIEKARDATFQSLILKTNEAINKMSKDQMEDYAKSLTKQLPNIKFFMENYIKYQKGHSAREFEQTEQYVNRLTHKIDKLKKEYEDQIAICNSTQIVLKSHEKMMDQMHSENFLLKNSLYLKAINDKVSFPICSQINTSLQFSQGNPQTIRHIKSNSNHQNNNITSYPSRQVTTNTKTITPFSKPTSPNMPTLSTHHNSNQKNTNRPMTANNFNNKLK